MAGTKAHLAKLFYSTDEGTSYTLVSGVTQIQRPTASKADIDMSDLESMAMEYEQDIPDYGTATYAFNFDGTNPIHQALIADEANNEIRTWKVQLPERGAVTVTEFVYSGTVQSCEVSAARGGKQEGTLNIRVNGEITSTHGATAS